MAKPNAKPAADQAAADQAAAEKAAADQAAAEKAAAEPKKTVTVTVPKTFRLTTDEGKQVEIKAGIQEMDEDLVDHWWMKVNGVVRYIAKKVEDEIKKL